MYAGFLEEGDRCPECITTGLTFQTAENCSCHLNAPCGSCMSVRLECKWCGWVDDSVEDSHFVHVAPGLAMLEHRPKPLDSTKIDYRLKIHSSSSMIKEGVYPEGTTRADVEAAVRGTFGGRFQSFGGGKFTYIAYTD